MQTDGNLAVRCLAQRARVLAIHTYRVATLLRKTRVVDHPNRIRFQFPDHPLS
jgi:hypothetical protein